TDRRAGRPAAGRGGRVPQGEDRPLQLVARASARRLAHRAERDEPRDKDRDPDVLVRREPLAEREDSEDRRDDRVRAATARGDRRGAGLDPQSEERVGERVEHADRRRERERAAIPEYG